MKIAFVSSLGIHKHGGTQKSVAWLIEDLAGEHEVSVFAPYIDGVDIRKIRFFRVPVIGRPAILRYLTFLIGNTILFAIMKLLKKGNFDIVNVTGADCLFANVITAHYCAREYMRLVREDIVSWPKKGIRQKLLNFSYRLYYFITGLAEQWIYSRSNIRLIIAVSEGLRRDIVKHYKNLSNKIVVIPNAVDEEMFIGEKEKALFRLEVRSRYKVSPDEAVLLFVAAGDWKRKGLELAIKALPRLTREVRLIVVGRDDIAFYSSIARENGVGDRIIFTGFSMDIKGFYGSADIFVFPSYFEAFSLVTLEAAATGLPIVAAKINGTEELIQDGYNGFFVRHDPEDIARKINDLLGDRQLMKRMGDNARRSAMNFGRREMARKTLDVFERAALKHD